MRRPRAGKTPIPTEDVFISVILDCIDEFEFFQRDSCFPFDRTFVTDKSLARDVFKSEVE